MCRQLGTTTGMVLALALGLSTRSARAQQTATPPVTTPPAPETARPTTTSSRPAPIRITFDDAIQRALTRNTTFELAQQDVRRAEAVVEQVRSTWLPTLNGNGTLTHLDADRKQNGIVVAHQDTLNANLVLNVPLLAPRQWVATARATDQREITKLGFLETRRQVALQAGRAYLTIIAQRRVLASSVQARDTAYAHEEFSKARLAGGVGNRLDAVRAGQERATSETRVLTQTIALTRAQEALGVLLGENGPVDAADVTLGAPPTLERALGDAEKRSDVVASKASAESARKSVRDSYVDYLPMLTGVVQPFYQNPATPAIPTTGWQAQLLLNLPIFDGGHRYGAKHERDAIYEQAKLRVEAALRDARSEVRVGFDAVRQADEALAKAQDAAKLAQDALELTQIAYRAGATSNIEVIDAERQARDAAIDAAIAEDSARQARLDLLAAAGKFP